MRIIQQLSEQFSKKHLFVYKKIYPARLYEGGIRVPFVVRWPKVLTNSRTIETPITGVDILPTLLEVAGKRPDRKQPVDGLSIIPLLTKKKTELDRDYIYWHFPAYLERYRGLPEPGPFRTTPASAIRDEQWKLIHFYETGTQELYNLKQDLSEQNNVASRHPEVVARLSRALTEWLTDTNAFLPSELNPNYKGGNE